jgi:ectoine hydroxylase-related dioxygenase (phytanoyl-CoA dioxygenase family)
VARDPRLLAIAGRFLNTIPIPYRATLFDKSSLRLHLDDSRADNGPLRVLPGTHTLGLLSDADVACLAREHEAVECLAPAGGIVAMRPLLVHASSKAETDRRRRVLHIEYADALAMGAGLELAIA